MPSVVKSVVNSRSCPGGGLITAQSSPMKADFRRNFRRMESSVIIVVQAGSLRGIVNPALRGTF